MLYSSLKGKHVPCKVKIIIYKTILKPFLLYVDERWTLTASNKSQVQTAEMKVLRLIKGVTRLNKMKNEDIRRDVDVKIILTLIEEGQLRWYRHVRRMDNVRILLDPLDVLPASDGSTTTMTDVEARWLFDDRRAWRRFWIDKSRDYLELGEKEHIYIIGSLELIMQAVNTSMFMRCYDVQCVNACCDERRKDIHVSARKNSPFLCYNIRKYFALIQIYIMHNVEDKKTTETIWLSNTSWIDFQVDFPKSFLFQLSSGDFENSSHFVKSWEIDSASCKSPTRARQHSVLLLNAGYYLTV